MNKENAIEVKKIKKKFKVYYDKGRSIKEKVLFRNRNRYEIRWVLNGISFSVRKGEAIGLIGQNGCGKSTTLKLLTRIMYPDEGTIEIDGRVSSLLELGAGFHPDMSGRENIYTNASIFGLTRKEIDERMADIVEFSELEEFLDNPVRTYSSGMYMRLAFSVAINVDADVLLIDEILAVGDVNFQAKCFNKLREIKANGTTIVIVSHSLGQIEQICDRTIWIQDGIIKKEGTPRTVHPEYMDFMGQKRQEIQDKQEESETNQSELDVKQIADEKIKIKETDKQRWGNGDARIVSIQTEDSSGKIRNVFRTGENIKLTVGYQLKKPVCDVVFGIGIFRVDGLQCFGTNTKIDQLDDFDIEKNGSFQLHMKNVDLLPGEYLIDIAIESGQGVPVDYFREAHKIEFYSPIGDVGVSRIEHDWKI